MKKNIAKYTIGSILLAVILIGIIICISAFSYGASRGIAFTDVFENAYNDFKGFIQKETDTPPSGAITDPGDPPAETDDPILATRLTLNSMQQVSDLVYSTALETGKTYEISIKCTVTSDASIGQTADEHDIGPEVEQQFFEKGEIYTYEFTATSDYFVIHMNIDRQFVDVNESIVTELTFSDLTLEDEIYYKKQLIVGKDYSLVLKFLASGITNDLFAIFLSTSPLSDDAFINITEDKYTEYEKGISYRFEFTAELEFLYVVVLVEGTVGDIEDDVIEPTDVYFSSFEWSTITTDSGELFNVGKFKMDYYTEYSISLKFLKDTNGNDFVLLANDEFTGSYSSSDEIIAGLDGIDYYAGFIYEYSYSFSDDYIFLLTTPQKSWIGNPDDPTFSEMIEIDFSALDFEQEPSSFGYIANVNLTPGAWYHISFEFLNDLSTYDSTPVILSQGNTYKGFDWDLISVVPTGDYLAGEKYEFYFQAKYEKFFFDVMQLNLLG